MLMKNIKIKQWENAMCDIEKLYSDNPQIKEFKIVSTNDDKTD